MSNPDFVIANPDVDELTPTENIPIIIPLCQPSQEEEDTSIPIINNQIVTFQDYYSDVTKVSEQDKNRFLLGACHGVVLNFSLKAPPYLKLGSRMYPKNAMFKQELNRRNP